MSVRAGGPTGGLSPHPPVGSCYASLYEVIGTRDGLDMLGLNALNRPGRVGKDGCRVTGRYAPGSVVVAQGVRGGWVCVRGGYGAFQEQWLCHERGDGKRFLKPFEGEASLVRVTAAPALSLRDAPSGDAETVGVLPQGTVLIALERRGRWVLVKAPFSDPPPSESKPPRRHAAEWILAQNARTGELLVADFGVFALAPSRPLPPSPEQLRAAALRTAAARDDALRRRPKHAFLRRSSPAVSRSLAREKGTVAAVSAAVATAAAARADMVADVVEKGGRGRS